MRMTIESRPAWIVGFTAGVIGGLVMVLVQSVARLGAQVPMFPDLFEDLTTRMIPAAVFSKVLDTFLFHPSFPVDIRHNAKIFREKLAVWATRKLA